MVEGARLESVCRGDPPTEGSNPSLSATKSCRCSHFGIARGLPPISSLDSGDVSGHGRGAGEVSRCLGRGGGRCPRDRLASQVRWSGGLREPCTTDPCQSSGPRSVGFQDGTRQVPEYAASRTSRGTAAEPTSQKLTHDARRAWTCTGRCNVASRRWTRRKSLRPRESHPGVIPGLSRLIPD